MIGLIRAGYVQRAQDAGRLSRCQAVRLESAISAWAARSVMRLIDQKNRRTLAEGHKHTVLVNTATVRRAGQGNEKRRGRGGDRGGEGGEEHGS
jgi:hypothetical protein